MRSLRYPEAEEVTVNSTTNITSEFSYLLAGVYEGSTVEGVMVHAPGCGSQFFRRTLAALVHEEQEWNWRASRTSKRRSRCARLAHKSFEVHPSGVNDRQLKLGPESKLVSVGVSQKSGSGRLTVRRPIRTPAWQADAFDSMVLWNSRFVSFAGGQMKTILSTLSLLANN